MPTAPWAGRLAPWLDDPARAGILTDFDGTLSPIVADPSAARPLPGAVEVLAALAVRYPLVAIVSGRPVAFLAGVLGALSDRLVLAGLYGLEHLERGRVVPVPGTEGWRPVVARVAADGAAAAPPGVRVEPKGLTVTLHARNAPVHLGWVEDWAAGAAQREGLAVHPGKMSVELRPPVAVDKGTVVADLSSGLGAAAYLGDDLGDLPAFAALGRLRAVGVATLAVAAGGPETPAEVASAADVVVDGPTGALELLAELAGSR